MKDQPGDVTRALCALTLEPSRQGKPARIHASVVALLAHPVKAVSARWREFPPGKPLLVVVARGTPIDLYDDRTEQEHRSARTLLTYEGGRFREIHADVAAMALYTAGFRRSDETRLSFMSLNSPPRYLLIKSTRSQSMMKVQSSPGAPPTWRPGGVSVAHAILEVSADGRRVVAVQGPRLEKLLAHPRMAPYRPSSAPGDGDGDGGGARGSAL